MSSTFAHAWRRSFGAVLIGSVALLTQCRVGDTLDDRPWPCDAKAPDCGDLDGKPMTCWEGFCMPSCDFENPPPTESGTECLFGDALVRTCDPTPDDNLDAECSPGFHCYRTDIVFPFGICVPFPVCSESADCPDPKRNVCASEKLLELAGDVEGLATNGFACISDGCETDSTVCEDDEVCLAKYYVTEAHNLPDICVPRCDGAGQCPPNYTCANSNAAPGGDRICIPGLPGVRCEHEQDCAFGFCLQTGANFKICSIPCQDHQGCEFLNSDPTYYRCIDGKEGKLCAMTSPFQGLRCEGDRECASDAPKCTSYSPFLPPAQSECRPLCEADGTCPTRAGLAQVCLQDDGTCYPGDFSMPCRKDSECLTPFSCREVARDERDLHHFDKICTIACKPDADKPDADCQLDPATPQRLDHARLGYCDGSSCRVGFLAGEMCDRDEQCREYVCDNGVCRDP